MRVINLEDILRGNVDEETLAEISRQIFGKTPEEIAQEIQADMPEGLKEILGLKEIVQSEQELEENRDGCEEDVREEDVCGDEEYINELLFEIDVLDEVISNLVGIIKETFNCEEVELLEEKILESENIDNDIKVFLLRLLKS